MFKLGKGLSGNVNNQSRLKLWSQQCAAKSDQFQQQFSRKLYMTITDDTTKGSDK